MGKIVGVLNTLVCADDAAFTMLHGERGERSFYDPPAKYLSEQSDDDHWQVTAEYEQHNCICTTADLMAGGCKCGGK